MSNFFSDNSDLMVRFQQLEISEVIELMEFDVEQHQDFQNKEEVLDYYRESLSGLGRICGELIAPLSQQIDLQGTTFNDGIVGYAEGSKKARKLLSEAGYMGAILPREYGGAHLPSTIYMMMIEMVSRADASLMTMFGYQDVGELIARFGSRQQKESYLPKLASGEHIGAIVLTEPGAGSDLQSIRLKAEQNEQGEWFLAGTKHFISNGCGDVLMVLARSEPDVENIFGLSLFACRGEQVKVNRVEEKMGLHGSPTCELLFEDSKAELIGKRKFGLTKYILESLSQARFSVAAQALGIAEGAYQMALEYAGQRRQFDQYIIDLIPVRTMLTEMKLALESSRSLVLYGAKFLDLKIQTENWIARHKDDKDLVKPRQRQLRQTQLLLNLLSPMIKYWVTEESSVVCNNALQVFGGMGYIQETGIEQKCRDIRITTIYEGTSQVQVAASIKMVLANILSTEFEKFERDIERQNGDQEFASEFARLKSAKECTYLLIENIRKSFNEEQTSAIAEVLVNNYCRLLACYLLLGQGLMSNQDSKRHKLMLLQRQITNLNGQNSKLQSLYNDNAFNDLEDKDLWFKC